MGRYDLTDEQYALIEPHLPTNAGKTGHPYGPHRPLLNGILWRLHTGAPWPDIPERYGNWKTIYDRYTTWRRDGTLDRIVQGLQLKLDQRGLIDYEQWALDGTVIRAHRAAAGARKKGGQMPVENRTTTPSDAPLGDSQPRSTS
ncbi:MAG TPA: IS5 family transposase [Roseiflexaceae bacterium]|nr:IS5 family transposase [Roseiflexaceae bacterium]